MKATIEHPKVFISYAWGDKLNQQKVLSFASELVKNGIDVLLDRWNLKEGNDKYSYMEKCVTDPSVTNVLLLLDENYTIKANSRTGGVGDETQIISPEIYGKVEQSKFLPIIFTKGTNGEVYKPAYLQSTLHIDLADTETYGESFKYLVKLLYGVEICQKPELGSKPLFVEEDNTIPVKTQMKFQNIKKQSNTLMQANALSEAFETLKENISAYETSFSCEESVFFQTYLKKYQDTNDLLNDLRGLLNITFDVKNSGKVLGRFFEDTYNTCSLKQDANAEIREVLIHEMFITTIAMLLKNHKYTEIGYLLGHTYFIKSRYNNTAEACSFGKFYCTKFQNLDDAANLRDNKRYYTGTGAIWMERIAPEFCSQNDFSLADILCYNYAVLNRETVGLELHWFPLTYIYGSNYSVNVLRGFCSYFISRERLNEILPMFNIDENHFKERIKKFQEENENGTFREIRYAACFESAPVICEYIKSEEIGKYR